MNTADRKFLKDLSKKVDETRDEVRYIVHEIPVNGTMGLKNVLTANHDTIKAVKVKVEDVERKVDGLESKVGIVWAATEKWRTRIELVKSFKAWTKVHPVLGFVVNALTGRVAKYVLFGAIGLVVSTIGIEAIVTVFSKFLTFILSQFTK